jgi:nitroreductase
VELAEVLRRRRMVRAYAPDRTVPPELVDRVCGAALQVPSAGFTQGVSLLVLDRAEERATYWDTAAGAIRAEPVGSPLDEPRVPSRWLAGMRTAPVLVLVWTSQAAYLDRYAQPDKGWTERDPERWSAPYWFVDGGMAALAMLLTATDVGLGACFFGVPARSISAVREAFGVPAEQLSVGVVSLGYAAPGATAGSPGRRSRRDPDELVHRTAW